MNGLDVQNSSFSEQHQETLRSRFSKTTSQVQSIIQKQNFGIFLLCEL